MWKNQLSPHILLQERMATHSLMHCLQQPYTLCETALCFVWNSLMHCVKQPHALCETALCIVWNSLVWNCLMHCVKLPYALCETALCETASCIVWNSLMHCVKLPYALCETASCIVWNSLIHCLKQHLHQNDLVCYTSINAVLTNRCLPTDTDNYYESFTVSFDTVLFVPPTPSLMYGSATT